MRFHKQYFLHPAGFNITPLLDILLVLIIFFILTWNFSRDEKELAIRVPSAKQGQESKPRPGEIILNVMSDGSVVLNRRAYDGAGLTEVLQRVAREFPDQVVILRADQAVPYKHVVGALDVCRAANIWNVAFATAKD
jgi:biopolymer transport protein ExbD